MLMLTTTQAVVAGAVMALWLGGAAWAVVTGLAMRGQAKFAVDQADRLAALVDTAPALPIVVHADGRVEAPDRLGDWLGLRRVPKFLSDFSTADAGLSAEDAAALLADVNAAHRNGRAFARASQAIGSNRTLLLRGAPTASQLVTRGAVIIWVFDATESQDEIRRLTGAAEVNRRAFDALSHLIEVAPIPMWHRGPDLRLTLVNRAYVDAVDATDADDVVARGVELVETSGGVTPIAAAEGARTAGETRARDVAATIGGQRRQMRVVDVPIGAAGVAGYALDNDEIDRARTAFRRFSDSQRDTLDRLSAGVAQFASDRTLSFCNMSFQRMFAMKPEWVADRPEFDRVIERMREAGRAPEARDFPAWKAERRQWFTMAGGVEEEAWLLPGGVHLRVLPQPLPDGGLLLIFEDRTEQVQLASARDTLLRVREATFDNLYEAVSVFAIDGRLHVWNNRFRDIWGFDDALLVGHPRIDTLAQAAAAVLANPARAAMIRDLIRSATVDRKARNGRIAFRDGRHFEFAAVPLPDGNALFTMLDITDSRRIERALRDRAEALVAADRVKTAFVANMSYELRTPLTSITGFAEMLDGGFGGKLSKAAREYVSAILESSGILAALVDDVLHLTESDAGIMQRRSIDPVAVLDALAAAHATAAAAKHQELVTEYGAGAGRIDADANALSAALDSVLTRAIADTGAGGRILLHSGAHENGVQFVVSDDGPGTMSASDPVIVAARSMAESHGGNLTLFAEPGVGAAVQIVIPR